VATRDGAIAQRVDLGPISFQAIDAYARRMGVADGDPFERFHQLIRHMDAAYRQWAAEKRNES
jgi:hypothetical protein